MDSSVELDTEQAIAARAVMVDRLLDQGMVTDPVVERAFRVVPRHVFVPAGTGVEAAYSADDAVVTKRDAAGGARSSVSAPFIQARMIEMAGVGPGSRVVEIGSGGYNAALLAEVVGPSGEVVSNDIDPEVIEAAQQRLKTAGYEDRVMLWCSDALHDGLPRPVGDVEEDGWDAIVVTVGLDDLNLVWLQQLAPRGRLVVPLRMNGVTRVIGFKPSDISSSNCPVVRSGVWSWDGLVSDQIEVAGFVPAQGSRQRPGRVIPLERAGQTGVELRFDRGGPETTENLHDALESEPVTVWSGVSVAGGEPFDSLHLWLACFLPGFCRIASGEPSVFGRVGKDWFPFGAANNDALGVLVVRPTRNGEAVEGNAGVEFGARAYGPAAQELAEVFVEQVRAWNAVARHAPDPIVRYYPNNTPPAAVTTRAAVLSTSNGTVIVSWPSA